MWLVYGFDGSTTAEGFAIPQAVRVARGKAAREAAGGGIGLPPAPKRVSNAEVARFLTDGNRGVFAKVHAYSARSVFVSMRSEVTQGVRA